MFYVTAGVPDTIDSVTKIEETNPGYYVLHRNVEPRIIYLNQAYGYTVKRCKAVPRGDWLSQNVGRECLEVLRYTITRAKTLFAMNLSLL